MTTDNNKVLALHRDARYRFFSRLVDTACGVGASMKKPPISLSALAIAVLGLDAFAQTEESHEYALLVKVPPTYPRVAQMRGLEGIVVVEFDLTGKGEVVNPRIIESQNGDVFNSSALTAVQNLRYRPRKVYGVYYRVEGVQQKLTYCLEEPSEEGAIQECRD